MTISDIFRTLMAQHWANVAQNINSDKMHIWSKFGDPSLNCWSVIADRAARTNSEFGKIRLSNWIWPWRSRSFNTKKTIGISTNVFYIFWFKPDNSSSNGCGVIVWTNLLTYTHRQMRVVAIPADRDCPRVKRYSPSQLYIWVFVKQSLFETVRRL